MTVSFLIFGGDAKFKILSSGTVTAVMVVVGVHVTVCPGEQHAEECASILLQRHYEIQLQA